MNGRFSKFDNQDQFYVPNNMSALYEIDRSSDLVIGGNANHVFELNFRYSELCVGLEITYKQGLSNVLTLTGGKPEVPDEEVLNCYQLSSNILINEVVDQGRTFIEVALTPEETSKFAEGYFRNTFAQLRLFLANGEVWYSNKSKINIYKPIFEVAHKQFGPVNTIKAQDFAYIMEYKDLDYDNAYNYFKVLNEPKPEDCSAFRNGNWYGRNYDWYYSNAVSIVVKTINSCGHYNSIGIACMTNPDLTADQIDRNLVTEDIYKILPFMLKDGINEKGVFCNINVVPNDLGKTTGTIPRKELRETISSRMLPRFILDRFATAAEAIQYLLDYVSVYASNSLTDIGYDLHLFIGDERETYVVEFVNDEIKVINFNSENGLNLMPAMTNFFLTGVEFNPKGTPEDAPEGNVYTPGNRTETESAMKTNHITAFGGGLERWNLIQGSDFASDSTENNARDLLTKLYYTHSYEENCNPQRYSDFTGHYGTYEFTVDTSPEDYNKLLIPLARAAFANRSRDAADT